MCGIAGMIGPQLPDESRVRSTILRMRNRGPDAHGRHTDRLGQVQLLLLHSRLSIIDLDQRAHQPFESDECVLSFNGEIYNYVELRRELKAAGHQFRTDSDTEVIIKAYRQWGQDCVGRLEGMWAFALLDRRSGELMLCRDRFGEKPLYYACWDGAVYFASEVKYLAALSGRRQRVNTDQVRRFLVNGYKSLYKKPTTFFEDVSELPPATLAVMRGVETPAPQRYWTLEYRPEVMSIADAVNGVRERLLHAMKLRLRADVPIAFCLSGGVDSTALASIAAKHFNREIHAFSIIDSDDRYDESENLAAGIDHLGCQHYITRTRTDGFFDRMTALVAYHDAPVATITYYVHAFLSEAISAEGFKVAISGTGADELFTGYYDHYGMWLAGMHDRPEFNRLVADWRASYGAYVQNPYLQSPLAFHDNPDQREHVYLNRELFNGLMVEPLAETFYESTFCGDLLRNRMLNELKHEVVPVLLHEDDLNSMCWSVENRSPYLDSGLAEFMGTVPSEHLIQDGFAKWLLRSAVADLAPAKVMRDKRKRGFNASIDSMVDRSDPHTREMLLEPGPIFDVVRRDAIERFLQQDMTDNSFSKFLFSLISARLFLETDLVAGADSLEVVA